MPYNSAFHSKIAALEKELEAKHQEHLKKSLEDTEKRWQEKYQELSADNDKLKSEVSLLNEKVTFVSLLWISRSRPGLGRSQGARRISFRDLVEVWTHTLFLWSICALIKHIPMLRK